MHTITVGVGDIAKIIEGKHRGRLVAVVDIIDELTVAVDGPATGVRRTTCRIQNLHMTGFQLKIPANVCSSRLRVYWIKTATKFKTCKKQIQAKMFVKRFYKEDYACYRKFMLKLRHFRKSSLPKYKKYKAK